MEPADLRIWISSGHVSSQSYLLQTFTYIFQAVVVKEEVAFLRRVFFEQQLILGRLFEVQGDQLGSALTNVQVDLFWPLRRSPFSGALFHGPRPGGADPGDEFQGTLAMPFIVPVLESCHPLTGLLQGIERLARKDETSRS